MSLPPTGRRGKGRRSPPHHLDWMQDRKRLYDYFFRGVEREERKGGVDIEPAICSDHRQARMARPSGKRILPPSTKEKDLLSYFLIDS